MSCQTKPLDTFAQRTSTVGSVHPNVEVKIINPETGETIKDGSGELCTRGYNVMLGYDGNEEATKKSIDSDGWMVILV